MSDGLDVGHVRRRVCVTIVIITGARGTPHVARPDIRPVYPLAHGRDQQSRHSARQSGVSDRRDPAADHAGPLQGRAAFRQGRREAQCRGPQGEDRPEYPRRLHAAESRRGGGFENWFDVWGVCEGGG